jgi:ankyrin repeat protein
MLCNAAARGNVTRLMSFYYAGADLTQKDISTRTPLLLAVQHNQVKRDISTRVFSKFCPFYVLIVLFDRLQEVCVRYLLERRAIIDLRDDLGYNAIDVGRLMKRKELVDLLEQHQQNRNGTVPVFEMF